MEDTNKKAEDAVSDETINKSASVDSSQNNTEATENKTEEKVEAEKTQTSHHSHTHHNSHTASNNDDQVWCILAYILFIIPLLAVPEHQRSSALKFHINQGAILLILAIVGNFVLGIIPVLGWTLLPLFNMAFVIFLIIGIVNAINKQQKRLPLIGHLFTIIK